MKPILIGSRALKYWVPDFYLREDADWDIVSSEPIEGAEFHDPNFLNNADIAKFSVSSPIVFNGVSLDVVSLFGLAMIKRSHLWRDYNFEKHICQYVKHIAPTMNVKPKRFHPKSFLNERIALTRKQFPQRNPKLNVSKEKFFDDYVVKKYDHDLLHEIVAHHTKPLYMEMQSGEDVWCDKEKWNRFTYEEKAECVAEEAYVIAAERFLIPSNWVRSKKNSFNWAMNKICTTLTSGWFRDFAIDNYYYIHTHVFDEERLVKLQRTLNLLPK